MVNISFWISEQFCVGLNFNQNCSVVLQKTFLPAPILQIVFYSQSMPKSLTFKVNIMFIHSRDNTSTNLIRFHTFSQFDLFSILTDNCDMIHLENCSGTDWRQVFWPEGELLLLTGKCIRNKFWDSDLLWTVNKNSFRSSPEFQMHSTKMWSEN